MCVEGMGLTFEGMGVNICRYGGKHLEFNRNLS